MRMSKQTVLAIAEDEHTRETIRKGLSSRGFSVLLAATPADGLISFLEVKPDYVILNVAGHSAAGLMELTDICEADPMARVIAVSSCDDDSFALECVRHGASDYLRKPLVLKDLLHAIERISSRSRLLRKSLEPDRECVLAERKTLQFGNDIDSLPYIINQAVSNASVVCPDVPMLKMALGEVVLNAIEHGNLGIGMKEKSAAMEKDSYRDLLRERLEDPHYAGRVVTLQVSMTRDELKYTVTDQGTGFDHKALFRKGPQTPAGSGMGLIVARSFFTRLSFRGRGNQVILVYRRPSEGV
jgi:ActR/RegA family two-component response regulator